MTVERFNEIDKELALFGWHYNASAEVFQATADDSIIKWQDIVVALPGLSINELAAFEDRKQERLRNRSPR